MKWNPNNGHMPYKSSRMIESERKRLQRVNSSSLKANFAQHLISGRMILMAVAF